MPMGCAMLWRLARTGRNSEVASTVHRKNLSAIPVIVVLAACGRGDATTQSAARLSMSQFISRADAICKQLLDSAGRVPMPSADPEALSAGDLPGVSTYLNAVVPLAKRALARIG